VATLCGHVVLGADAVRVRAAGTGGDGTVAFTLARPGPWFEAIDDGVLPTGRGGRPCVIWTPR
jgi:hypothetical protein